MSQEDGGTLTGAARQSRPALSLGLDREGWPLARTAHLREGGDGRRSLRASCVAEAAPASAGRGRVSRGPVTSGTRSAAPGLSTSEVASAGTRPLADRTHAQASGNGGSLRKQKPDSNARLPRAARAGDTGAAGGGQRPAVLPPYPAPPSPPRPGRCHEAVASCASKATGEAETAPPRGTPECGPHEACVTGG